MKRNVIMGTMLMVAMGFTTVANAQDDKTTKKETAKTDCCERVDKGKVNDCCTAKNKCCKVNSDVDATTGASTQNAKTTKTKKAKKATKNTSK